MRYIDIKNISLEELNDEIKYYKEAKDHLNKQYLEDRKAKNYYFAEKNYEALGNVINRLAELELELEIRA